MRLFVTGAGGKIGQAVTKELLANGHQVLGLARSDDAAGIIEGMGAEVQRGSLTDLDILKKAASECDGVIHLAFAHHANFVDACAMDRAAITAMGSALQENQVLVMTSGLMAMKKGQLATEDQKYDENDPLGGVRGLSETVALDFAAKGVRVAVMRLPCVVFGEGSLGFVVLLASTAEPKGYIPYLGDGKNRWPATHTLDVARAYRLAVEKLKAKSAEEAKVGSVFHPAAEHDLLMKDIASVLAKRLGFPVVSISQEEATKTFGVFGNALGADNPVSSAKTREELGWVPLQAPLLENLEAGECLQGWTKFPSWAH